jgi:hypothetical protein
VTGDDERVGSNFYLMVVGGSNLGMNLIKGGEFMKLSFLFVVLVACGSSTPTVTTTPRDVQTCESKLATCESTSARQCSYETELRRERDIFLADAEKYKELAELQAWQLEQVHKKLGTCNTLNSVYDSVLLTNDGCMKEVEDGEVEPEG